MRTDRISPVALGEVTGYVQRNDHTSAIIYPAGSRTADPIAWVAAHADALRADLSTVGLCLLRGFPIDLGVFGEVVRIVGGDLLEYTERSTPRTAVSGNIYTSTDYPADQFIPMHNENSYSTRWPSALFFYCHTAPASGGATPIADSRAVLRLISSDVRERFASGVIYTRTFREGLGLSWQEAFRTTDRAVVQAYCTSHGQEYEWIDDGLRTRHHRPATQHAPHTGEKVWFNQANLFHASSLDPDVRDVLLSLYGEQDLPRHAYLGDGGPIGESDLADIKRAYDEASLAEPWQAGDILMVNNMLMAHGRQPFTGDRRILVAMA